MLWGTPMRLVYRGKYYYTLISGAGPNRLMASPT